MSEQPSAADFRETAAPSRAALSPVEREQVVMRYWRHGNLTPLGVANSLVRQGSRVRFAGGETPAALSAGRAAPAYNVKK